MAISICIVDLCYFLSKQRSYLHKWTIFKTGRAYITYFNNNVLENVLMQYLILVRKFSLPKIINITPSTFLILTVNTAALAAASFSLLKTFTIIFQTLRFWTLTPLLYTIFITMLNWVDILAILTLTICPAYSALRKTLAILRLAARLGTFTFDFAFDARFVGLERKHIIKFAITCLRTNILKAKELR